MSHRTPRIAAAIVHAAFDPSSHFNDEPGAELEQLIDAYCDDEDADWIYEEDRKTSRVRAVQDQLRKAIAFFEERRIVPPLRLVERSGAYYRFVVIAGPGDDAATSARRARYRLHHVMLKVLRALSPDDFEALCALILVQVGCTATYVTQASQDFGVDFFGRMPVIAADLDDATPVTAAGRVLGGLSMILFGQAKRYSADNVIPDGPLKELYATANDVKNGQFDNDLHPDLERGVRTTGWKSADPVLLVFATTSSLTRRARSYAERQGIATLDGDQIAQLLLEEAIGVSSDGADGWIADKSTLVAALAPD